MNSSLNRRIRFAAIRDEQAACSKEGCVYLMNIVA